MLFFLISETINPDYGSDFVVDSLKMEYSSKLNSNNVNLYSSFASFLFITVIFFPVDSNGRKELQQRRRRLVCKGQ